MSTKQRINAFLMVFGLAAFSLNAQNSILPSYGNSRTGITGMQFLKIAPDARSAGMGGNVLPVVNDVSSMYWNPAGLSKLDTNKLNFQFGHTAYFAGIGLNYAGTAYRLNSSTVIGLSLISLNTGDMPVTTEFQPFGTGETYSANSTVIGLSMGKNLTDFFSFGITGKFAREGVAGVNINNALFDLGFLYDIGIANTRFGVNISNFGFNVQPNGSLKTLSLSGKQTLTEFQTVSVPAIFRLGFAWDPIKNETHTLTTTAQLNHPTDNNESFGIGGEYAWKQTFYGRMGYEFGIDETGLPAFGIGVKAKRNFGVFRFDYGYNNKDRLGNTHRFTIHLSVL